MLKPARWEKSGVAELSEIKSLIPAAGYDDGRVVIDPSVVRGLEYYTGPVFEVELTFPTADGSSRFGSVGGGGRYDGLVSRFRGEPVPATGFSIGVSRLAAALQHLGKLDGKPEPGPVVVTVFDKDRLADYQNMVAKLRAADIRAELYLGSGKFGAQMKYADKRNAPCVVIQGSDEKAKRRGHDQGPGRRRRAGEAGKGPRGAFAEAGGGPVPCRRGPTGRGGPQGAGAPRTFLTNALVPTSWRSTLRLRINGARQSSSNGDACRAKGP